MSEWHKHEDKSPGQNGWYWVELDSGTIQPMRFTDVWPMYIRQWREMDAPEPPEPEKPDIQRVCEWLGVEKPVVFFKAWWASMQKNVQTGGENDPMLDAELWDIETELHRRVDDLHPTFEGEGWWRYRMARHPLGRAVSMHDADTRGETLLKAAKWLMGQEGSDGR